jgi:hypothetical protein
VSTLIVKISHGIDTYSHTLSSIKVSHMAMFNFKGGKGEKLYQCLEEELGYL